MVKNGIINMKYPYAFACYPTGFIGCKVSATKICLQYSNPLIKLRMLGQDRNQLPKDAKSDRYATIREIGDEFEIVATGCQMPEIEALQAELIVAYKQYYRLHSKTYEETYKKDFKDFVRKIYTEILQLYNEVNK